MKRLAIVGSTGSIGQQTLDVIRALPQRFQVEALAAGENTALLAEQVAEFKPRFVCYSATDSPVTGTKARFLPLDEIVARPEVDIVVIAAPGKAGLGPTLAAVRAGKTIALANKESLVTAGGIITGEAKLSGARIFPVDS